MKLQFKHQKFQADAAKAVVDVFTGWSNTGTVPGLSDEVILEHINEVQRRNQIEPSSKLEGRYNLTIEMETGVGKTYTYIKTMYELNKQYGFGKFIVVVPSIAVREGVYKTFQVTQEHFAEEYGKKIRFFIYHSSRLTEVNRFASDSSINVMIINSQAFNARGKDARRIYMQLDEFGSRRPIDVIAETNPILIIDEPQSVEGKQTRERLREFHPLMTLRYSATHRSDSIYNMVYRLDAVEAYNKRLVKKIAVKGISDSGSAAAEGYVYLESIQLSRSDPVAIIQFDYRGASGIYKKTRKVKVGFNIYDHSGDRAKLEAYKDGFVVKSIDGRDNSVEFMNGIRIYAGDVIGRVSDEQLRRIQIRETILSHIERERQLFYKGIKVLSLFFIDEVAHYREYDEEGQPQNGLFARMFEEEYLDVIGTLQSEGGDGEYANYLETISAADTHAGYFSIDKKGRMSNGKLGDKHERTSDDVDAYDLIMKNKEQLLDCDPQRSPVRFIFSHSALREGWDNPNVFQICTLKQSSSEVRKRQEVGRGLRLCVNQDGERMDANILGSDVHNINVLTVIASESYDSFAKALQSEMAEVNSSYDLKAFLPENARSNNVELKVVEEKLAMPEFRELWSAINQKSVYVVNFDTNELVQKTIDTLNAKLRVSRVFYKMEKGAMEEIKSRNSLAAGTSFVKEQSDIYGDRTGRGSHVKYDLIGKLVDETGLTRKAVVRILTGIRPDVFSRFKENPEEFIMKAAALINEEKAMLTIRHITYKELDERYGTEVFTEPTIRGKLGVNAMKTGKHLYDHLVYDSARERDFAAELEASDSVAVYVKLPKGFYISTPVGRYTPDYAIAFGEGTIGHVCLVAETKGAMSSGQPHLTEELKIRCAREHFKAIGSDSVVCEVVDSYEDFLKKEVLSLQGAL